MTITLSSLKALPAKIAKQNATAVLALYADPAAMGPVHESLDATNDTQLLSVAMNDAVPGHTRGRELPNSDDVLNTIKWLAIQDLTNLVVADPRGKGLAISFAIIARWLQVRQGRQAVADIVNIMDRGRPNLFVLELADALLGSNLYQASATRWRATTMRFDLAGFVKDFQTTVAALAAPVVDGDPEPVAVKPVSPVPAEPVAVKPTRKPRKTRHAKPDKQQPAAGASFEVVLPDLSQDRQQQDDSKPEQV